MNEEIIYRAAFDAQMIAAALGCLAVLWFIGSVIMTYINDKNDWEL